MGATFRPIGRVTHQQIALERNGDYAIWWKDTAAPPFICEITREHHAGGQIAWHPLNRPQYYPGWISNAAMEKLLGE